MDPGAVDPGAAVLVVRGLGVSYGGVRAVDGIDLDVGAASLVGLIGPNGAGKTTCIDGITGFVRATGRVRFDGHQVEDLRPHQRARLGLVRTFQSLELFDDLTVLENLLVAAPRPSWWARTRDAVLARRDTAAAESALAKVGLDRLTNQRVTELSLGQRKLVAVARALARRPRLLLLDEPAAGLDTHESLELGHHLRRLVDGGLTILLVDHDMHLVLGICDDVYVLDFGRVIFHGNPSAVRADPSVVTAYLGTGRTTPSAAPSPGP